MLATRAHALNSQAKGSRGIRMERNQRDRVRLSNGRIRDPFAARGKSGFAFANITEIGMGFVVTDVIRRAVRFRRIPTKTYPTPC